jgi:hypothetical protein
MQAHADMNYVSTSDTMCRQYRQYRQYRQTYIMGAPQTPTGTSNEGHAGGNLSATDSRLKTSVATKVDE